MPTRPVAGLLLVLLATCATVSLRSGVAGGAGSAGAAAATRPAAPAAPVPQRVVRVISNSTEAPRVPMGRGRDAGPGGGDNDRPDSNAPAWLVVVPVEGGKVVRLNVADEFRRRFNALRLARGEWVTVTLAGGRANGRPGGAAALNAADTVASVARFDGPRGLANPKAYVLDGFAQQKVGAQEFWTVKLSKFGQTKEALIPNRTTAGGAPGGATAQPDAALVARLRSVSPGDVIEVDLAPGPAKNTLMLVDAGPAREPLAGDFVKLATLKDAAGKAAGGVVIETGGKEQTYALSPAQAAALQALAKRLKPGHGVRFTLRDPDGAATSPGQGTPAGPGPATSPAGAPVVRDLRLDGQVEPTGEKSLDVVSTYVRVELSEARRFGGRFGGFGGPGRERGPGGTRGPGESGAGNAGAAADNVDIRYHPGSARPDDRALTRGVDGVLNSEDETRRLGITPQQYKDLDAALRGPRDERPTGAESAQWAAAYKAWLAAGDDEARRKVEQEMLWAAQGLSARYREDFRAAAGIIRSVLTPAQLAEVLRAGREEASGGQDAPERADEPAAPAPR